MELTVGYEISPRLSFTGNVKNLGNEDTVQLRYGSQTPGHARQTRNSQYGALVTIGIKGSF